MTVRRLLGAWVACALILSGGTATAAYCPFCTAVSQTFSEEMSAMDVVVIAKLVRKAPDQTARIGLDADVSKAEFEITQIVRGEEHLMTGETLETIYFGDAVEGDRFLVMGVEPPRINWSTPLRISERACAYVTTIPELEAGGAERLRFFMDYLEDEDEMLARDSYDEFANAPYDDLIGLKEHMRHDQLIEWIRNDDIPATRKRLYLVMLGVCGGEEDLPLLEELMQSEDRRKKAGLDAMIGCYLTLRGAEGMPLIEELFLKNQDADYADTYAAIAALRFHGTETDLIPRERILEALEYMLERPRLADLVIPDLARWEHWQVMDRLVRLFMEADEKTSWVRVPVINFLRACPLPEAREHLVELEKIDPDAVRRANTFFPLPDDDFGDDFADDAGSDAAATDAVDDDAADNADDDAADDPADDRAATEGAARGGNKAVEDGDRAAADARGSDEAEPATRFVSTVDPLVGEQVGERSRNGVEPDGLTASADSVAAVGTGGSAIPMLAISLSVCVGLFFCIWGLLTGRLLSLVS